MSLTTHYRLVLDDVVVKNERTACKFLSPGTRWWNVQSEEQVTLKEMY